MTSQKPVRWWPALFIAAVAAGTLAIIWLLPAAQRQQRYLRTAAVILVAAASLFLWLLFASRLSLRVRLGFSMLCALGLGAFCAMFHIRGVNGDLLPILEPRWHSKQEFAAIATAPKAMKPSRQTSELGEFKQFYGPRRTAVIDDVELETNWIEHPPQIIWKRPVGAAWSGFAVADGLAITLEQRGEKECVVCYNALSGEPLWSHEDSVHYGTIIAGEGPRSTPTIASNRVYTFGGTGVLNCLDAHTGKRIWSRDTAKDNGEQTPDWGFTCSPLVLNGAAFVSVGGKGQSFRAYSAETGDPEWAEGDAGADYSSPIVGTLLGKQQILVFEPSGITSRDLSGKRLWNYPWRGGHPHITPPLIVSSNEFVASSGYGTGAELVTVTRTEDGNWTANQVWKSMALKSKFAPIFHIGEYLYGLDDGMFTCLKLKTGQRMWKDGRYGHGQGLQVGSMILLTTEKGGLVIIQPSAEKLIEVAQFQIFADKTWNPPALAGSYLFIRNDKEAACVQLRIKKRA